MHLESDKALALSVQKSSSSVLNWHAEEHQAVIHKQQRAEVAC
jgi:hypothetical protein